MSIATTLRDTLRKAVQNKSAPPKLVQDVADLLRFVIRENQLCAQLGLSKDELRRRRLVLLVQGAHWDYIDKRVLLNALGAEILRKTAHSALWESSLQARAAGSATADCGTPRAVKGLLPEKNPPPVVFDGRLVVWQIPTHNPRLVIAHLPGTDPTNPMNLVTCLVRSNLNFLRGLEMPGPGRQVKQLDDQRYELLGEPPRARGRW
jgi:hypothetical protein